MVDLTLLKTENPSRWVAAVGWGGYREEQKQQSVAGSVHRAIKRPVGEWMGNFALYWTDAACRPRARCWVHRDEEEVLSALRGLVSRGEGNVSSCVTQL